MAEKVINYGFACKAIGVLGTEQSSLTLAKAELENFLRVSRLNIFALTAMLKYCKRQGIPLLRISSDIIPLASHPDISFDWKEHLKPELLSLSEILFETGIRVSMHPGQYTILNSPKQEVIDRAIKDVYFHVDFLDAIKADSTAKIILHLGGAYGDKTSAIARLIETLRILPNKIKERLTLENDDRIFTIQDVLFVCEKLHLPAIFDVFHHSLNPPDNKDMIYWLDRSAATWKKNDGRQKIHYSQQLIGGKVGSHSQTIDLHEFMAFHSSLEQRDLDVMLEVKDKNISAVKCINLLRKKNRRKWLTEEWARYKYLVLEHSPFSYNSIREMLKDDEPDAVLFYSQIQFALSQTPEKGHAINAAQHVWGYLNEFATAAERKRIFSNMDHIDENSKKVSMKRNMLKIAQRHGISYLQGSLYFYL